MKNNSLLEYKNLVKTIAVTDFKLKYQGSILGYLWSLVKPLMLFAVMYFVFTQIFNLSGSVPYWPVYLLLGIVVWTFFTETTVTCLYSIVNKRDLIRKVYFPRIVLVFSSSITSFLTMLANLVIVFVFMAFNHVPLSSRIMFLPLYFVELYFFALGVGLILGALYVKFRDIAHIWEVVVQALFYATPILYAPTRMTGMLQKVIMLSPVAQIIQDVRWGLISGNTVRAWDILYVRYSWIPYFLTPVIFFTGYYLFEKMAAKFAEEV
jgi:ABC-2 type transport system permease protein